MLRRRVIGNLRKHGVGVPGVDDLPPGRAWLLAEYGADTGQRADELVQQASARVTAPGQATVITDESRQGEVWEIRRSAIEYARIPGEHAGLAGWEDAAVPPERLGDYIRDYCALLERHGYHTVLFGHFGQGCMHNRLDLDLETQDGVRNFSAFLDEAGDLVARYGGSMSGEHGDGRLRAGQLRKMFGDDLVGAFEQFKQIWDPESAMNPGRVVHPDDPVEDLRQGPDYAPRQVSTHFAFAHDERGFSDAVGRCFGIGLCRHTSGGTMCPSFMVTREEANSTRGRARLLFEMMAGHLGPGGDSDAGWRDEHVKGALDLCLSCKGCKGDCPVNVDMATYKAEFLSHYYAGRLRPRAAYALGLIPVWAHIARRAPGTVNLALHAPGVARLGKLAAGVEPARDAPRFARRTFRDWFASHETPRDGDPVMLWPDTFTDGFDPQIGIAAVQVLEDAGCTVRIPDVRLCCGRPLFDYGMLPTAKRWLRRVIDELAPAARDGIPLVGLEPSCLAVFRDELTDLFPADGDARRIAAQSVTLAELLLRRDYRPPQLKRDALVQTHCHQHAVIGDDADAQLMQRMGLTVRHPDTGCCGMAGSFGFERGDKYDVSIAAGERVLLPAVRAADPDTLILADGFSCREQIRQGTGRHGLHLAQVLAMARTGGQDQPSPGAATARSRVGRSVTAGVLGALAVTAATAGRYRKGI